MIELICNWDSYLDEFVSIVLLITIVYWLQMLSVYYFVCCYVWLCMLFQRESSSFLFAIQPDKLLSDGSVVLVFMLINFILFLFLVWLGWTPYLWLGFWANQCNTWSCYKEFCSLVAHFCISVFIFILAGSSTLFFFIYNIFLHLIIIKKCIASCLRMV
jgi:hypothetical protein